MFDHLRRCYFNRIKVQYRRALGLITSADELLGLIDSWEAAGYSDSALMLAYTRLLELESV